MKSFQQCLKEATVDKEEFIEKMSAIQHVTKKPWNRMNEARYRIEVETALVSLGLSKKLAKTIYDAATSNFASTNRSGIMLYTPIGHIYNALKDSKLAEGFKIGDKVHLGFGSKGGAGYDGEITQIEDGFVWIKNKWHGKTQKGPLKYVSKT